MNTRSVVRRYIPLIALLSFLCDAGYAGDPVVEELLHENGKIESRRTYVDERLHGKPAVEKWDAFGNQILSTDYREGERHGLSQQWYEGSTQLKSEGSYTVGLPDGPWTYYRVDGTLEREASYRNGFWNGKWIFYNTNGDPDRIAHYKNGQLDGEFLNFDSATGIPWERIFYKAGEVEYSAWDLAARKVSLSISPEDLDQFIISASIQNLGTSPVSDVMIKFFLGNAVGGKLIGFTKISLQAGESIVQATTTTDLDPSSDGRVYMLIDPNNTLTEFAKSNNGVYSSKLLSEVLDLDEDGLPDNWETKSFKSLAFGPDDDFDQDQSDNRSEYIASTNPNDPSSYFTFSYKYINKESSPELLFNTIFGRSYIVQRSDNLIEWSDLSVHSGSSQALNIQVNANNTAQAYPVFYRIRIDLE